MRANPEVIVAGNFEDAGGNEGYFFSSRGCLCFTEYNKILQAPEVPGYSGHLASSSKYGVTVFVDPQGMFQAFPLLLFKLLYN